MSSLVKNFLDFIMDQPDERKIDHTSWSSCAVGDWTKHEYELDAAESIMWDYYDPMLDELTEEMPGFFDYLNDVPMEHNWSTYGELKTRLKTEFSHEIP